MKETERNLRVRMYQYNTGKTEMIIDYVPTGFYMIDGEGWFTLKTGNRKEINTAIDQYLSACGDVDIITDKTKNETLVYDGSRYFEIVTKEL